MIQRKHVLQLLIALAVIGVLSAALYFRPKKSSGTAAAGTIWTCSMHPQIRMNAPGTCPICGMNLIPVKERSATASDSKTELQLDRAGRQMAQVESVPVERRALFHEVRTVGRVDFDETRMKQIASRVEGRVERVFADFPGTMVKEGDHLVSLYSPELVSTQEELILSSRREQQQKVAVQGMPSLTASARRRLRLWGISDTQIDQILETGKPQTELVVYAPIGGTVVEKMVRAGQYVQQGERLYTIADLTHVWLLVEVYERDLPWVKFGQTVDVSLESDPKSTFEGQVGFVEPILNEQTRTVRVRVILRNQQGNLKPGMFAQALIRVPIMPDGTAAPTGLEGKYACPMHPYVISEKQEKCRVCEMAMELVPGKPRKLSKAPEVLAVPADAVLTTGRRQLVYVQDKDRFRLVEPHLGSRAGDYYPVLHGLKEGDRVVARGNFLLDSQFQISGKSSLLYPEGISGGGAHAGHADHKPAAASHQH